MMILVGKSGGRSKLLQNCPVFMYSVGYSAAFFCAYLPTQNKLFNTALVY